MDTSSSFIPHEHPLVVVEECLDLFGHSPAFFPVLTVCCSVSVWGTNL
jgi:hypothetical protein